MRYACRSVRGLPSVFVVGAVQVASRIPAVPGLVTRRISRRMVSPRPVMADRVFIRGIVVSDGSRLPRRTLRSSRRRTFCVRGSAPVMPGGGHVVVRALSIWKPGIADVEPRSTRANAGGDLCQTDPAGQANVEMLTPQSSEWRNGANRYGE